MKAIYSKPMLTAEMFSATQPVTRDCGDTIPKSQLNQADPAACVWDLGGGAKVFVAQSNCNIDGEKMGYGCYNNPSEGNYVFRS